MITQEILSQSYQSILIFQKNNLCYIREFRIYLRLVTDLEVSSIHCIYINELK